MLTMGPEEKEIYEDYTYAANAAENSGNRKAAEGIRKERDHLIKLRLEKNGAVVKADDTSTSPRPEPLPSKPPSACSNSAPIISTSEPVSPISRPMSVSPEPASSTMQSSSDTLDALSQELERLKIELQKTKEENQELLRRNAVLQADNDRLYDESIAMGHGLKRLLSSPRFQTGRENKTHYTDRCSSKKSLSKSRFSN